MGMKMKGGFNLDGLFDEIKSKVENNPEILTSQNLGKEFKFNCPICEEERVATFTEGGKCKCNDCNNEFKLNLNAK